MCAVSTHVARLAIQISHLQANVELAVAVGSPGVIETAQELPLVLCIADVFTSLYGPRKRKRRLKGRVAREARSFFRSKPLHRSCNHANLLTLG